MELIMIYNNRKLAAIAVIFDDEGRVLLAQRNQPESLEFHNKWQLPGGGIEHGEHPRDTIIREVKEEVDIDVTLVAQHPLVFSYYNKQEDIHTMLLVYTAKYLTGKVAAKEDTNDARWFNISEIDYSLSLPPLSKELLETTQKLVI